MSPTIAIYGAGPALGRSLARRFGGAGYRVALVARNRTYLDTLVAELADEEISAAAFVADLSDRAQLAAATSAILDTFGQIDVLEYSPGGLGEQIEPALDVTLEHTQYWLDLFVLSPIALVRQVLPAMIARGSGALLFSLGTSAKYPTPSLGNIGIALAGLRNYIYNLNSELGGKGVYAGALTVGALIENSAPYQMFQTTRHTFGFEPEVVSPDALAEHAWDMCARRDRPEDIVGSFGQ